MEASVKHSMRRCGIKKGDRIAVVDDGIASGAMMWSIFSKVLGPNPHVKMIKFRGYEISGRFTKIAIPYTREEAAALLIKSLAGISGIPDYNDRKVIFPVSAIGADEAGLYCGLLKIRFGKKKRDEFTRFVCEMEIKHPGTSSQAVRFLEKLRD